MNIHTYAYKGLFRGDSWEIQNDGARDETNIQVQGKEAVMLEACRAQVEPRLAQTLACPMTLPPKCHQTAQGPTCVHFYSFILLPQHLLAKEPARHAGFVAFLQLAAKPSSQDLILFIILLLDLQTPSENVNGCQNGEQSCGSRLVMPWDGSSDGSSIYNLGVWLGAPGSPQKQVNPQLPSNTQSKNLLRII